MKFRRLTIEELQGLEQEFVQFLAANTVTGDDWKKIKEKEIKKANDLIDVFSDLVFEKIIKDIKYLEFKTTNDVKTFHCKDKEIILLGLQNKKDLTVDLSDKTQLNTAINSSDIPLQVYSAKKHYSPSREQELFKMLQNGASISKKGDLFKALKKLQ